MRKNITSVNLSILQTLRFHLDFSVAFFSLITKMDRYRVLNQIGDGAFGTVFKAVNRSSGEVAAIKRMKKKYHTWEE